MLPVSHVHRSPPPGASGTQLFVYGTLRHDQPEHARYCRGVRGWRPARVRGRLVPSPGGHRLLVVPPQAVFGWATADALADEARRRDITPEVMQQAAAARAGDDELVWIDGELLEFADATVAWPPIDAWEDAAPGQRGLYRRGLLPVEIPGAAGGQQLLAAWAYFAVEGTVTS